MTRYQEYLQTDTWRNLKERARHRDGSRCRICNSRRSLQVHHRQYPAILGTETLDDLTTLCGECHKMFHRIHIPAKDGCSLRWAIMWFIFISAFLVMVFSEEIWHAVAYFFQSIKHLHCFQFLHCNVNKFILRWL